MKIIVIRYCLIVVLCLCAVCAFGQFETKHINKEYICWDKNNPDSARFFLVNSLPYKMGVVKDQQTNFLGVVDSTGNIQIPFAAYDTLLPMYLGKKNAKGRIIEMVFLFTHKNSPQKMGSMDSKGNIILPNIYDYQEYTYAKTQILAIHENKKKIINTLTCKVDFETDLQAIISPLKEGNNLLPYWQIAKNGKKIIVSFDGNVLSDSVMYDKINSLGKYGCIKIELDGLIALYNNNFKPITPIIYQQVEVLKNGLIFAKIKSGGSHLLDSAGNVLKTFPYDYIGEQDEQYEQSNFYIVGQNGYVGLLDRNFQQIYPAIYSYNSFNILHQGYFIVQRGDLQGLVDTLGKEIILPMFDDIEVDCKGFKLQKENGMHGYFEPLKNIFIPAIYEDIYCTQQNYYVAKKQGFMGLLDTNFNEIVPFIYEEIQPIRGRYSGVDYQDTLMCFKLPNKTFFIYNLKNDSLYFTPYHEINEIEEGLMEVVIHSTEGDYTILKGCMNLDMQEIVPCRYNFVSVDENFVVVSKNEKYGLWGRKGNEILPCKYAELKIPINYYDPKFEIKVKKTDDSKWEIYNVETKTFSPDKK